MPLTCFTLKLKKLKINLFNLVVVDDSVVVVEGSVVVDGSVPLLKKFQ